MIARHRSLWIFCLLLLLAACTPSKPTFKGMDVTGVDWGGDITLQGHTGKPVSTADFRGKVLVLFFGYTHCPDICAPTLAKLAALHKALGADSDRMQVLFVTVDPAHDTPQQLADFVPKFDRTFVGLTCKPEEIAAAARAYKIAYVPASADAPHPQIDHSSGMVVKDADGKVRLLWKNEMPVEDMAYDVRLLLKQGG